MNWLLIHTLSAALIGVQFSLVFLAIYRQRPDIKATRDWGYAYLLLVAAMLTIAARIVFLRVDPHIFSNALAAFAGAAVVFLYSGIRHWRDLMPLPPLILAALLLMLAVFATVGYFLRPVEFLALVTARLYIGGFGLLCIHALLRTPKARSVGHYAAALFLLSFPVSQIISFYILLFLPSIPDGIGFASVDELASSTLALVNFAGLPVSFTGIALFCLLGLLIEMARELRLESHRDWLTAALNRRGFFEVAGREVSLARRYASPLSVIICDMDDFKSINDIHGHERGDEALRTMASVLSGRLRSSDVVARWGGEEFIILLPGAAQQSAVQVAEQLRESVEKQTLTTRGGKELRLTASFGISEFNSEDADIEVSISRADFALYRAKREGKNRVVASEG